MRVFVLSIIVFALFFITGCSTNENDPLEAEKNLPQTMTLPVNAEGNYYISLSQAKTVEVVDPLLEDSWDIVINNLTNIRVKGGSTAPGEVYVQKMVETDYNNVNTAPDGMYKTDTENENIIGEGWYFYDVSTHTVNPLDHIYIIKTGSGEYYKLKITESSFTSQTEGELKLSFEKIAAASVPEFQDKSGRVRMTLLALSGEELSYFRIKDGEMVKVSDPESSVNWDIETDFVTLKMNSGTSGPGHAGAMVYKETLFDDISSAPTEGYAVDDTLKQTSAIGDAWYSYDSMTHSLAPHPYAWVVKTAEGKFAKLEFVKTEFTGQSGGLAVVRFEYLENGNQF